MGLEVQIAEPLASRSHLECGAEQWVRCPGVRARPRELWARPHGGGGAEGNQLRGVAPKVRELGGALSWKCFRTGDPSAAPHDPENWCLPQHCGGRPRPSQSAGQGGLAARPVWSGLVRGWERGWRRRTGALSFAEQDKR